MLQFLSIYLLLSIKCFHCTTTGPSSKRHLHVHKYTTQTKFCGAPWLHILLNHSALCSQGLASVIPRTLRKKLPTSPRITVFRNIRGGGEMGDLLHIKSFAIKNFVLLSFLLSCHKKNCHAAITYEISYQLFEYFIPKRNKKADAQ